MGVYKALSDYTSHIPKLSKKSFPGSHKFLYHDRRGNTHILYGYRIPEKFRKGKFIKKLSVPVFIVLFAVVLAVCRLLEFKAPEPLIPLSTFETVHVTDEAKILDDTSELEYTLGCFQGATGICPHIITVYHSDWINDYNTFDDYLHYLYKENFDDEQHFLFVYSVSDETDEEGYVQCRWGPMFGDDTVKILNKSNNAKFNNELYSNLNNEDISISDALNTTFFNARYYLLSGKDVSEVISEMDSREITLVPGMFVLAIIALIKEVCYYIISNRDYIEVSKDYDDTELK